MREMVRMRKGPVRSAILGVGGREVVVVLLRVESLGWISLPPAVRRHAEPLP
jgi:hypothetical protein